MIKLSDKKAALFDLGSTLIEYENTGWYEICKTSISRCFKFIESKDVFIPDKNHLAQGFSDAVKAMIAHSKEILKEPDLKRFFIEFFKMNGYDLDSGLYDNFLAEYFVPLREQLTLIDGAHDVLELFKKRDHKLAIISNTVFPVSYHYEDMQHFGIKGYFDEMVFSSEFEYRKPHPAIFEYILRKLDISADQAFFVGDRVEIDVAGAKNANILAILKKKSGRQYDDYGEADIVIDDLHELIEYY